MELKREDLERELISSREFFQRSTRVFDEGDSLFAPVPGAMTVAQQVSHTAQTINWFVSGAFSSSGFDLDFAEHARRLEGVNSLEAARDSYESSFGNLMTTFLKTSDVDWLEPMADGPVMGGEPRKNIFIGIIEHTAHHRGALTVYARLLNKVPPLPYMDL